MKTLLAFAVFAAMAVSAQAATIYWGLGADVYLVKASSTDYASDAVVPYADGAPTVNASSYLALVYVGSEVSTFSIDNISESSVVIDKNGDRAVAPFALDTDNSTYADYDPYQITSILLADDYADKSSFSVVWFDADRGKFDYVYSIDDGSAINTATTISDMSRGSESINIAGDTNGYGGVLAVPEPATAALALLGLGMLLKRRRA